MFALYIKLIALALFFIFLLPTYAFLGYGMLVVIFFILIKNIIVFKLSCYSKISNNSIFKVYFDKGLYGEYLTVRKLEGISKTEKILVNVYLDNAKKENETTETDIIYINEAGIFSLESKNYSGWIYGSDNSKMWSQTLGRRKKNKFFNPVWQNEGHISAIKNTLGVNFSTVYNNIVVFSERCTLKNINVTKPYTRVVKRNNLHALVKELSKTKVLTENQVNIAAKELEKYCNVSQEVKDKHIKDIKLKI